MSLLGRVTKAFGIATAVGALQACAVPITIPVGDYRITADPGGIGVGNERTGTNTVITNTGQACTSGYRKDGKFYRTGVGC